MRKEDVRRRYIKKIGKLMIEDKDSRRINDIIAYINSYYDVDIFKMVEEDLKREKLELLDFLFMGDR